MAHEYASKNPPASSAENASAGLVAGQQQPPSAAGDGEANIGAPEKKVSYMRLPNKGQLAILCIARLADPLATTSIQAYMFYQLKSFNPDISDSLLSTQAGIIVGAKTAAAVCTGMLWGRVADSDWGGRKVVLMIGLLSSGIASVGYGFSRTFVSAVAWQVFGGAMSSNVGITRCVVAELNPEKRYRTRALLLLPLFASAGQLLGPLVGGLLSSQRGFEIFKSFPYALPNLFIAGVYAIAVLGVSFGLEETSESLQHTEMSVAQRIWNKLRSKAGRKHPEYVAVRHEDAEAAIPLTLPIQGPPKTKAQLPFRRIWTRNVLSTMLSHFIIAGHLGTFTNLWAIFLSTPIGKIEYQHPPLQFGGGLGLQPREVGLAMSAAGALSVVLQLVLYPMLNDRFGTIKIWQAALFIFPIVYVLAPFSSLVASENVNGASAVLVWVAMLSVLFLFVVGRTGVTPATTLLINDCTPHPSVRGTVHTAGTVIGNLSRSFFPVLAFSIFGRGLDMGVVGLGFWCLAGLAVLACVASRWVVEGLNGQEIVLEDEAEPAPSADDRGPSAVGRTSTDTGTGK